jgi:hypothetical protein
MDSSRQKAQAMVNRAVKTLTGGAVDLSDLSDTFNLCAGLDELQEAIEASDSDTPISELQDLAQEVATQLLEEEGFPI